MQNIAKITSAMKMVAASKMRVAQVNTEKSRGLLTPFIKLLGDLPGVQCWLVLISNLLHSVHHAAGWIPVVGFRKIPVLGWSKLCMFLIAVDERSFG